MMQIKFIKDTEKFKVGEIAQASKKSADSAISNGYAELVEEEKEKKMLNKEKVQKYINKWAIGWADLEKKLGIIEEMKKVSESSNFNLTDLKEITQKHHKKILDEEERKLKEEQEIKAKKKTIKKEIPNEDLDLENTEKKPIDKQVKEIQEIINLRASVFELLSQKHPDRNEATELLSRAIKRINTFYSIRDDLKSETWVYDNGIYVPNGRSIVNEFCRNVLLSVYTESLATQVYNKIKEDSKINADEFFKYDYIDEVPVLNGILNTRTRELSNFNSKKIFFNKIPVEYNPNEKCPKIEQFLKDVLAEEDDIKVFYEIVGDALSKRYDFQKSIIQYGEGSNGKGISQSILKHFFGFENCSCVNLNQMTFDSHSLAELFGKYLNLAGDLDRQALKETGTFKLLTSGTDGINAKRKYLNDLKFLNFAKMIFACNEFPRVYDTTFGFWRRWIILNYPYKFISKEEYDLLEDKQNCKIKNINIFEEITTQEEMSGLMNLALDGLERLRKQKNYSSTVGTEEIKNFWIRKSSPFTAFCIDCIEESYNGHLTKKELRVKFSKYTKSHNVGGSGDKEIKAILQDLFGASEERKTIDNYQENVWSGIRLKDNYKDFIGKKDKKVGKTPFFPNPKELPTSIGFQKNPCNPHLIDQKNEISKEEAEKIMEDFE